MTTTPLNVRRPVQLLALTWAAFEVINAFLIEMPVAALVVAGLFLAGAWWAGKDGIGGILLLGALAIIELVFLPTYPRESAQDWALQSVALVLGVAMLVVCWRARRS